MKRCPQCSREYDDSMSFCLDDGSELLFGPASMDEPATAILHSTAAPGEAPTRAQIPITDRTAVLPTGTGDVAAKPRGLDKRLLLAPLESIKRANEFCQQAVDRDPNYAPAYVCLARSFNLFSWWSIAAPKESFPHSTKRIRRESVTVILSLIMCLYVQTA